MIETSSILEQAAKSVITQASDKPSPETVVNLLLEAEKQSKKSKEPHYLKELEGTWRLCFITGTKKTRNRAGILLGAGRYIPSWVKIEITYSDIIDTTGRVENCVKFTSLQLSLTGPIKFLPQKNILAFDFTKIKVQVFGVKVYEGFIRGGKKSEEQFYQEKIKKQAFFAYFLIQGNMIAARGRGGGLALWGRENS